MIELLDSTLRNASQDRLISGVFLNENRIILSLPRISEHLFYYCNAYRTFRVGYALVRDFEDLALQLGD